MREGKYLIVGTLIVCLTIFLYHSTFQELMSIWRTNEDYSHGFLIIPISLYLVWHKRAFILRHSMKPSKMGILILGFWALLYILGVGADISTFERVSLVVFLLGAVLFIAGKNIVNVLMFPIIFLLFMMPIPAELYTTVTAPLARAATACSVSLFHALEVPVLSEGNLIALPNYSMEVISACSGIRSLISIMALAIIIGYFCFSNRSQRVSLLIFAIPVSIVGNTLRITITGLLAYSQALSLSFDRSHAYAGFMTLILSFLMLMGISWAIRWVEIKRLQYISWYLR